MTQAPIGPCWPDHLNTFGDGLIILMLSATINHIMYYYTV